METETVCVPREDFELMQREIETFRNSAVYKRLLEFEKSIAEGKKFTRKDLGF